MATYAIYDAKARFSEVLRKVRARNEVVITERGKPIARVVPYVEPGDETIDQRWQRMEAEGRVIPAPESPRTLPVDLRFSRVPGALKRFLADR